jgi:hypothetical protein
MDLCPPVAILHRQISTYTLVRKPATTSVLVAIVLRCSGDLPHFPFWGMMACSVGCMMLLMAYHAVIALLAR